MFLEKIILTNFRNYKAGTFEFSKKINCIVGKNGAGKTNLLDAIYYICMTKSNFGAQDRNVVKQGADFFRLDSNFFIKEKKEKLVAKVQPGKLKVIELNGVPYDKLLLHIGLLPVVLIAPDDTALAKEGSEERRKFLDNTLSQLKPTYLTHLLNYNRLLKQRNAALKQFGDSRAFNKDLIHSYNKQMLEPAHFIFEEREKFLNEFKFGFQEIYKIICGNGEQVDCSYYSKLREQSFETLLLENEEKDRILQRTTVGIHKDDLRFKLNDFPLKRFSSQGQLKSFILALKLAQFEYLKKEKQKMPLLLLDDLFDKLDDSRVKHLIQLLLERDFGQIFITDTHENRIGDIIQEFGVEYKTIHILSNTDNLD